MGQTIISGPSATNEGVTEPGGNTAGTTSQTDLGQIEQLRLQETMDRKSKFVQTMSNVLKKMSDSGKAIVSNLK